MSVDKAKLWQAYIDGELSASETAEFEASLTGAERERLAAEQRFERGFSETLSRGGECPAEVWRRTLALVSERRKSAGPPTRRRWAMGGLGLLAAASIALMLAIFIPGAPDSESVVLAANTVEELAALSETEPGREAAVEYLRAHDIGFELVPEDSLGIAAIHYGIEVVGARASKTSRDEVVELLMACCEYPIKLVMAPRGSATARALGKAASEPGGEVQALRVIDGYVAAVVGKHPAPGLIDLFADEHHMDPV